MCVFISIDDRFSKNTVKLGYGIEIINQEMKNRYIKLPATFSEVFKTSILYLFRKQERSKKFVLK